MDSGDDRIAVVVIGADFEICPSISWMFIPAASSEIVVSQQYDCKSSFLVETDGFVNGD